MSGASRQDRLDLYYPDLVDSEPEQTDRSEYRTPSRLRGEVLDQPSRATYVFGNDGYPIPLSLCAFQEQRLIVVEMDVATVKAIHAEWPSLAKRKVEFANRLLPKLRSHYVGLRARVGRRLRRETGDYYVQGPFIPYQSGIAIVSLIIRVGLDSNFDQAYRIAKRFLDLHPGNERFELPEKTDAKPKPKPAVPGAYMWTNEELYAIESMAVLEPDSPHEFGANHTQEERARFNEIVWNQCQQRPRRNVSDEESNAAGAATRALREFFRRGFD